MDSSASPNGAAPQAKRKIRNFLIDRRFQLGWVARVACVTALILGAMGYFLFGTLAESTDMMVTQTLAVEGLAPSAQQAFIEQNGLGAFRYVVSAPLGISYQVSRLPYAVLIDAGGVLRARGIINSREHLESLFEAQRLGVASLQDYLEERARHQAA